MSYDIDTWHTKRIENFTLSLKSLFVAGTKVEFSQCGFVSIDIDSLAEVTHIAGDILEDDDTISVSNIDYYGVCSGRFWDDFKKILSSGKGILEAVQVWEGGDSITRLTVVDGTISETLIEL
jgi:hypothetical protein